MRMMKAFSLAFAAGIVVAHAAPADVTVLHRFTGDDGTNSQTALTVGPDGRLYGTQLEGGAFNRGTVFAIDPATGTLTTLHDFANDEGLDPFGQLLLASDGIFYGTTRYGGDPNCPSGCGTIYRISPSGAFAQLHQMHFLEGTTLQGGLIEGPDGRLYGTATLGGQNGCRGVGGGCGSVYAFTPATAKVKVLHLFQNTDGRFPYGRLLLGDDGLLYGTTSSGAAGEAGTVYRVSTRGTKFKTLAEFAGSDAGCQPKAGLIQVGHRYYGAAEDCGSNGAGAVYSISRKGDLRALYRFDFDGYARTGKNSLAELVQGPGGDLFGTARLGGKPVDDPDRAGVVFRLSLKGKIDVMHTFMGAPDGAQPTSGLTVAPDGNLYGVTPVGGSDGFPGHGVVYRLTAAQ